jgi:hypothetical protein
MARGSVAHLAGVTAMVIGDWRRALGDLDRAREHFGRVAGETPWELDDVQLQRLSCLWWLGEAKELGHLAPRLLRDAQERGDRYFENSVRVFGFWAPMCIDRPAQAEAMLPPVERGPVEPGAGERGGIVGHSEQMARTWLALYRGERDRARALAEAWWRRSARSGVLRLPALRVVSCHSYAIATLGDPVASLSRATARRLLARLDGERVPWAGGVAAFVRAALARRDGRATEALVQLEHGEAAFEGVGMRVVAACARRRCGEWLGGDEGDRLVEDADRDLVARGIQAPARMTDALIPRLAAPPANALRSRRSG